MNFCAKCGRERPGDARYCGGCGTEFAADSAAAATPSADDSGGGDPQRPETVDAPVVTGAAAEQPEPPAEPAQWGDPAPPSGDWTPAADATRVERHPDVTIIDRPSAGGAARAATPAEPDPFATWFAPDAQAAPATQPAGQRQAAEPWQAADTVYAGSGQQASGYAPQGYPPQSYPPSQPAPGYPPPRPPYGAQPGPPSGRRPASGGRKAAFIAVVVLVMLAAGGGAYVLVSRSGKHNTAQPTITPSTTASAPSSAPPSSAGPSTSSTAAASPSASASASPTTSLVSVGAGVGSSAAEPAVEKTLNRYFQGINTHNYDEYQSAHNAAVQATESESAFDSGYGSTKDSGMTLVSLESTASGGESATVTFTSRQAPSASIDGSACNDWQVTYFLVPAASGGGYVIGAPAPGYKPSYSDC